MSDDNANDGPKTLPEELLHALHDAEVLLVREEARLGLVEAQKPLIDAAIQKAKALAHRLGIHERRVGEAPAVLSDDAYIDQRSGLAPKEVYLRLARLKAFPSEKVGKRVVARWGDVRAALAGKKATASSIPTSSPSEDDGLDDIRCLAGIKPKGGR